MNSYNFTMVFTTFAHCLEAVSAQKQLFATRFWLSYNYPLERYSGGSLEKWQIPDVGERKYKLSLKYLVMPESKATFKSKCIVLKGQEIHPERASTGQSGNNLSSNKND